LVVSELVKDRDRRLQANHVERFPALAFEDSDMV
jgi:hypothetical protein